MKNKTRQQIDKIHEVYRLLQIIESNLEMIENSMKRNVLRVNDGHAWATHNLEQSVVDLRSERLRLRSKIDLARIIQADLERRMKGPKKKQKVYVLKKYRAPKEDAKDVDTGTDLIDPECLSS